MLHTDLSLSMYIIIYNNSQVPGASILIISYEHVVKLYGLIELFLNAL